jgi:hypothetical protein
MCVCINKKINMNLLFLFIDARVRIKLFIQIYFIVFYLNYIKIKNMHAKIKSNKINLLVYSLTPESGIKILM